MNERLRLDYLDAMGIVQYAAHFPLPGALPSPDIEYDDATHNNTTDEYSELQTDIQQSSVASTQTSIRKIFSEEKTERPAITPQPSTDIPRQESNVFHCQVALWVVDDLLVLTETPRMDNQQLVLLRNIMKAIGRTEQLAGANQFSWPLPQHKDKGLSAARDHFQGMLDSGALKNTAVRQILCFGSSATTLLSSNGNHTAVTLQYHDWPITTVCTLHAMLEQPAKKMETWRALQILVRT